VIADQSTNLIVVATRHDTHASLAQQALAAGKHVFVEKPLALSDAELDSVLAAEATSAASLMVGFNRRFSPSARLAAEFFSGRRDPLSILYRVNAGRIARDSWIQDPVQGGGRIIGEVCHFVDLMNFLTGSIPVRVFAESVATRNAEMTDDDSVFITLKYSDGSNGTIAYLAEGDRALAKERIEIFGGGKTFVIDDFRRTAAFAGGKETVKKFMAQDKGQADEVKAVCSLVRDGGEPPIAVADLAATTRATFRILDSLRTSQAVDVA
jgi:predicted dehydrogenase